MSRPTDEQIARAHVAGAGGEGLGTPCRALCYNVLADADASGEPRHGDRGEALYREGFDLLDTPEATEADFYDWLVSLHRHVRAREQDGTAFGPKARALRDRLVDTLQSEGLRAGRGRSGKGGKRR